MQLYCGVAFIWLKGLAERREYVNLRLVYCISLPVKWEERRKSKTGLCVTKS